VQCTGAPLAVRGAPGSQKALFLVKGDSRDPPPKLCTRAYTNVATPLVGRDETGGVNIL